MDNIDLNKLKKYYGEDFAKFCRTLFPTILEQEGKLYQIISSLFAPTKSLYEDIIKNNITSNFKEFIFLNFDLNKKQNNLNNDIESPFEIMKKAGYNLYKCETNEDVLSFKKYWKKDEELCTFRDSKRIYTHIIYFAVKDNVDSISREDFVLPRRQDEYGTSVISIQFSKGKMNTISIKNRYNHSVSSPDSTFSNDLDNIYPGLTDSFIKECKLNLIAENRYLYMPNYVNDVMGMFYQYNVSIKDTYFCSNNIVIEQDRIAQLMDKNRFVLIEQFLLDKQFKRIINLSENKDSFVDSMKDIKTIEITKVKSYREINITTPNGKQKIVINKNNAIICYENENLTSISDNFLRENTELKGLVLPNLVTVGNDFLYHNNNIDYLNLPNLTKVGNNFLFSNDLTNLNLPNLEIIGNKFLLNNVSLRKLCLPKVKCIGDKFLYCNTIINDIKLPNVTKINDYFLFLNREIINLDFPKITTIGTNFMYFNRKLNKINMPSLKTIDCNFLFLNKELSELSLPKVTTIKNDFLHNNCILSKVDYQKSLQ